MPQHGQHQTISYNMNENNKNKNIIYAYLLYGIFEEHRFYPNMLTSFIPKLFVKEYNISKHKLFKNIQNHLYKNGWCVDLNDDMFNKYYKIITGYHDININYNRNFIISNKLL